MNNITISDEARVSHCCNWSFECKENKKWVAGELTCVDTYYCCGKCHTVCEVVDVSTAINTATKKLKSEIEDRDRLAEFNEKAYEELQEENRKLLDDVSTLKHVLKLEEEKILQWEKRAKESINDLMRAVQERDSLNSATEKLREENTQLRIDIAEIRRQHNEEKCDEELQEENRKLKEINQLLHKEYMEIRELVGSWDTNTGGENRFELTKEKILALQKTIAGLREALQRVRQGHKFGCVEYKCECGYEASFKLLTLAKQELEKK